MGFWGIFLMALGLSMDAFTVSVSNGMCTRNLKVSHAVKMAFSFGFFQALMPIIGYYAGVTLSGFLQSVSYWIAFGLLTCIGLKMIYEALKKIQGDQCVTRDPISFKMLMLLSVATSIDALAVGISLALVDQTSIGLAAGIIGVVTFLVCLAGVYIGKRFGTIFEKKAEILGGLLLIGIGVKILVEGLIG
nr:manganese efflux pump MntP family protein [uncultured Solibaculum sp.]